MKMIKQRFRERSESWLSASTDRGHHHHPPHPPAVQPLIAEPANPPVSILSHSTSANAGSANGQLNPTSLSALMDHPSQATSSLLHQDRPRKKLSFRDPEVTSMASKDGDELAHPQLALLKDQGFCDSMENVDLEVSISFIFSRPF